MPGGFPSSAGYIHAGTTKHFSIYYDKAFPAKANARGKCNTWLHVIEGDYSRVAHWFSGVPWQSGRAKIMLTRGNLGASWGGYNSGFWPHFQTFVSIQDSNPLAVARGGHVAELSEQFMMRQDRGWFSPRGVSGNEGTHGEALSQMCMLETYHAIGFKDGLRWPGNDFVGAWLDDGRSNMLLSDKYTYSGIDFPRIGCEMAFMYFLMHKGGYSLREIVHAGGANMAATYNRLSGNPYGSDPFPAFRRAIDKIYPPGRKYYLHLRGRELANPWPR